MKDKASPDQNISATKVVWVSFLLNISDVVLGVIVTILSGSVVVLSQALEGAADLAASGLLVLGLNRSKKKADDTHPFGYGREMYFWTLISALIMLFVTSFFTVYLGFQRVLNPEPLQNAYLAYAVLIFAALTNGYSLSLSMRRLLHRKPVSKLWSIFYHSSLIETKSAFVLDLMATTAALVGFVSIVLFGFTGDAKYDGYGAIAIGITLGFLAILLLFAVKDFLIGKGVPIHTIERIKNASLRIKYVNSVQDLKAIHVGPDKILINIEINVADELTTDQLEKLIDRVKDEIRKDIPDAGHIQIELESPSETAIAIK
jgi:cation diffusion facilitator family transporter